jgi:hypothetical protein
MARNPRGRPTTHTPETAEKICRMLAEGQSLRAICRSDEFPSEAAVRLWVLDDREGFAAQYARARELQAHAMADEILDIADDGSNDWMKREGKSELNGEHVQRSRARIDARKWLLSKMLPKVYGEKISQEVSGPNGAAIPFVLYGEREAKDADEWQKDNPPPA